MITDEDDPHPGPRAERLKVSAQTTLAVRRTLPAAINELTDHTCSIGLDTGGRECRTLLYQYRRQTIRHLTILLRMSSCDLTFPFLILNSSVSQSSAQAPLANWTPTNPAHYPKRSLSHASMISSPRCAFTRYRSVLSSVCRSSSRRILSLV